MIEPDFSLLSLSDIGWHGDLPETRDTLEGNSLQKASTIYDHFRVPCFADDTGLEVQALNGEPGVYSARYAGPQRSSDDNIELLLQKLKGQPNRKARFRTVITLIGLGDIRVFEGAVEGTITAERRGSQGFGYDPVFVPQGYMKTMAEMTLREKNLLSHRGQAVRQLVLWLKNFRPGN